LWVSGSSIFNIPAPALGSTGPRMPSGSSAGAREGGAGERSARKCGAGNGGGRQERKGKAAGVEEGRYACGRLLLGVVVGDHRMGRCSHG